ncbi:MAG: hypothetical protein WCI95_12360 [bacterium]
MGLKAEISRIGSTGRGYGTRLADVAVIAPWISAWSRTTLMDLPFHRP